MTKALKASGFLGLATMMVVGLYQFILLSGGTGVPSWMIGGHAHLGVISILAIVMGFAVPAIGVTGQLRTAVTVLFIAGQWGIPGVVWIGEGAGLTFLMPTAFLGPRADRLHANHAVQDTHSGPNRARWWCLSGLSG
ncbi:hypothetical protein ACODNH_02080 (plasmid) [Haloarcula sp. NS06]|uniref:hypothetical protein n=1 Tax=Haloarcula sp. NS06 TaxID=3409688 RepID=UPI003DA6F70C